MFLSRRSLAIAGAGAKLLATDPAPFAVTIVTPLMLTAFVMPVSKAQLRATGYVHANGAEQLIPGMAVLFALLGSSLVSTHFFREHAWGTWDRLRSSPAATLDIVIGKVLPLYVINLVQLAVLFVFGALIYDYRPSGSIVALVLVLITFSALLAAFGVMLAAVCSTLDQTLVIANLGGMVMGGIGGALAPASALPHWVQTVAHFTPAYWTLDALRRISLNNGGLRQVAEPILISIAFAVGFSAIAAFRFRPSDTKVGTT